MTEAPTDDPQPWAPEDVLLTLPDDVYTLLSAPDDPGEEADRAAVRQAIQAIFKKWMAKGWKLSFQNVDRALDPLSAYQRLVEKGYDVRDYVRETCANLRRTHAANGHDPGAEEAGAPDTMLCLTPAAWAARDIPPQDRLLGDVFTTTTRSQLAADTGLGKTMFALATGFAMRLGEDFLGWKGHREARVLIIDGEMPPELIKARLAAAASWFGCTEPITDGFFLLAREDVEDMPPLDTPDGLRWLLDFISKVGRIDHITLDNIAALTASCMKEEDGERVMADLRRALTKQRIGQLWLHHTGHDATRGYGTKIREWHLDSVMVAEKLERPDTDVSFTLRFSKCRRRTPDNRDDFETREAVLSQGSWEHTDSNGTDPLQRARSMPEGARLALAALRKAVADLGMRPPAHDATVGVRNAVTLDQWRLYFRQMAPYGDDQAGARHKAFQRGADRLVADGVARQWGGWVWLTE